MAALLARCGDRIAKSVEFATFRFQCLIDEEFELGIFKIDPLKGEKVIDGLMSIGENWEEWKKVYIGFQGTHENTGDIVSGEIHLISNGKQVFDVEVH